MTSPQSLADLFWIDTTPVFSPLVQQAISQAFDQLHEHVETYIRQQLAPAPLPFHMHSALAEIDTLMDEILMCLQERDVAHDEVVYRIGYMLLCVCLIERAATSERAPQQHLRTQMSGWLDAVLGMPMLGALEIAIERYRRLCLGHDVEFVDRHVLVPIARRHLGLV